MTSLTPKKKQKRQFRQYDQTDMLEAHDLHLRSPPSLIERVSCVIGCNISLSSHVLNDSEVSVMIRESLPFELQYLPQYWFSKTYLQSYENYQRDLPGKLPMISERRTTNWLFNPWSPNLPACVVEGYRWLEWKGYKHALLGPLKANRWVYQSPVSKNILIHGVWRREFYSMDSARISISIRRGASHPWAEKLYFKFSERLQNTLIIELLSLVDGNKAIWPFSFALPNPSQGLRRYKITGKLMDLTAVPAAMIWTNARCGFFLDNGEVSPVEAFKMGTEIMLWLKWVLGLDSETTDKEDHVKYPWIDRLLLPSFQEDEVELAHRARWSHSVLVLDKPHTKPIPENPQSFEADV